MPFYEVFHAIPLSRDRKDTLAEFITHLHSTTFSTPRFFVNVRFDAPPTAGDLYSGGRHRGHKLPSYIVANIRTGPTRTKADFDKVAIQINKKWDEVVKGGDMGHLSEKQQREAKKLKVITFRPFVAALESGVVVPEAGEEAAWIKENMPYFEREAHEFDNDDAKEMLEELKASKLLKV